LQGLREGGLEPQAVASLAVLVGSAESVRPVADLDELARLIDFAHISRAPAKFDEHELEQLNARLVHEMPYEVVSGRLDRMGIGGGQAFWLAIRSNLGKVPDAGQWWRVIEGPIRPVIEDREFVGKALEALPPAPWDNTTWKTWTDAVKAKTGAKGKALFMPLRLALTGVDHGPELAPLLPLIGEERAKARLAGKAA
jgi:glutamyl-tRNA synthetase